MAWVIWLVGIVVAVFLFTTLNDINTSLKRIADVLDEIPRHEIKIEEE